MNKQIIITILLALVAMAGHAQVKCHIEGTLETDAWGDEIIICEAGTDLRVVDEPRFHVKAKDGHFTYDIETGFAGTFASGLLFGHQVWPAVGCLVQARAAGRCSAGSHRPENPVGIVICLFVALIGWAA